MSGQDNMQLLCKEFPAGILTRSYNVCICGSTKTILTPRSGSQVTNVHQTKDIQIQKIYKGIPKDIYKSSSKRYTKKEKKICKSSSF